MNEFRNEPWMVASSRFQRAQERLVPVTKGSVPEAPDGGHNSQSGTLLDALLVVVADDPPELPEVEGVTVFVRDAFDEALVFGFAVVCAKPCAAATTENKAT